MRTLPRAPKRTSFRVPPQEKARSAFRSELLSRFLAGPQDQIRKPWTAALGLWLFVLILTPIGLWTVGPRIFPALASAGVLIHALVTGLALAFSKAPRWILAGLFTIAIVSWGVEALGVATGFPFGHYSYTSALQPQALGVPLLIPLAWFMMLGPAWGVAERVLRAVATGRQTRIAGGLARGV